MGKNFATCLTYKFTITLLFDYLSLGHLSLFIGLLDISSDLTPLYHFFAWRSIDLIHWCIWGCLSFLASARFFTFCPWHMLSHRWGEYGFFFLSRTLPLDRIGAFSWIHAFTLDLFLILRSLAINLHLLCFLAPFIRVILREKVIDVGPSFVVQLLYGTTVLYFVLLRLLFDLFQHLLCLWHHFLISIVLFLV